MVIPLISLMALWAYAATSTIGGAFAQRAYDTENSATGGPDSALLDQLIQERTLTYIWMSSGRRASPAAMDKQRPLTDAAIAGFRGQAVAAAGSALSASTRQDLTPLSARLDSLAGIRTAADKGTMSPLAVFGAYNAIVDAEFQFFRGEAVISDGPISLYQEGAANIDGGQAGSSSSGARPRSSAERWPPAARCRPPPATSSPRTSTTSGCSSRMRSHR